MCVSEYACVCVCVCVCVCMCVYVCARACERACVRAYIRACVQACMRERELNDEKIAHNKIVQPQKEIGISHVSFFTV